MENDLIANIRILWLHCTLFPFASLGIVKNQKIGDSAITKIAMNNKALASDPFFRTAYNDLSKVKGFNELLSNHTYVLIKPDGIVGGSVDTTLHVLENAGYEVCNHTIIQCNAYTAKLLWFYTSMSFPRMFLDVSSHLMNGRYGVLLLLRDHQLASSNHATASERLCYLKGSAVKQKRSPWNIREQIGSLNGLFAFIHAPDDPSTMIRELGVLLTEDVGAFVQQGIKQPASMTYRDTLLKFVAAIKAASDFHDLDYDRAMERLRALSSNLSSTVQRALCSAVEDPEPLKKILHVQHKYNLPLSPWDITVIAVRKLEQCFEQEARRGEEGIHFQP